MLSPPGMCLQPRRDGRGRAIGEQIHPVMAFEITLHGPEASASPPRPFIAPNHPWGRTGGEGQTLDETQNRPDAPRDPQGVRQQPAGTAANCDAHTT